MQMIPARHRPERTKQTVLSPILAHKPQEPTSRYSLNNSFTPTLARIGEFFRFLFCVLIPAVLQYRLRIRRYRLQDQGVYRWDAIWSSP
ncbi:MAG: hypothetical protein KatS3mg105_1230 [Gemmatales bacterium]|nr:MAG: hypothetical protein KatS3mg105_1230 [Gemmatales bacterium]